MDALELAQLKHQFLGEMAGTADERIRDLVQEALLHRGGGQHLGALNGLIEAHRDRVAERMKALEAEEGDPPAEAKECRATISGIHDALAYLRAQSRAAELSASQADAALQEAQRHRASLAALSQHQDGKIAQMMAELDAGTPREELGRPASAEQVRAELDKRREDSDAPAPARPRRRARTRARAEA